MATIHCHWYLLPLWVQWFPFGSYKLTLSMDCCGSLRHEAFRRVVGLGVHRSWLGIPTAAGCGGRTPHWLIIRPIASDIGPRHQQKTTLDVSLV